MREGQPQREGLGKLAGERVPVALSCEMTANLAAPDFMDDRSSVTAAHGAVTVSNVDFQKPTLRTFFMTCGRTMRHCCDARHATNVLKDMLPSH